MNLHRILVLAATMLLCGCDGSGSSLIRPNPSSDPIDAPPPADTTGLPAVDDIPRGVSTAAFLPAVEFVASQGIAKELDKVILEPHPVGDPEVSDGLSFVVYSFEGIETLPAAIMFDTLSNNDSQLWLAIADFEAMRWHVMSDLFFNDPSTLMSNLGGNLSRFISEDQRMALALIMFEGPAPVSLLSVELIESPDVTGLTATRDRWDSVHVTWEAGLTADGYLVYRRKSGTADGWDQLTPEPLTRFETTFVDTQVVSNLEHEYLVRLGTEYQIQGEFIWLWSNGVFTTGMRRKSDLDADGNVVGAWPANLQNFLSFFYVTESTSTEPAVARSETYPPGGDWSVQHSGDGEFGLFNLDSEDSAFEPPFALLQAELVNNPLVTLSYSNDDGAFAVVGNIAQDGTVTWDVPTLMRSDPTTHILGLVQVPRHINAYMWNSASERLEAMQSEDEVGRMWFDFNPDSWMTISDKKPGSPLDSRFVRSQLILGYSEAVTGSAVLFASIAGGWEDISPGLTVRDTPYFRDRLINNLIPAAGLIYLEADGSAIRMLPRDSDGWQVAETVTIAAAQHGEISEYALYSQEGVSTDTYLAYIDGGQVYCIHTTDRGYENWSLPKLVDLATDCRKLKVIFVGTDPEFVSNYLFASYVKDFIEDSDEGTAVAQLNYRDVKILFE